jgi:ribosomal protein L37AE/L43A
MPTSKRSQIDDVQYPRLPSKILKGTLHEEVINDETDEIMLIFECMECRDTQISCIAARVWQSHPRHADLRKASKQKRTSTQKYLAEPLGAPLREAFIPDIKSLVYRAGWQGYESTTTSEGHASGAPN